MTDAVTCYVNVCRQCLIVAIKTNHKIGSLYVTLLKIQTCKPAFSFLSTLSTLRNSGFCYKVLQRITMFILHYNLENCKIQ